jgi:hypothetical protein
MGSASIACGPFSFPEGPPRPCGFGGVQVATAASPSGPAALHRTRLQVSNQGRLRNLSQPSVFSRKASPAMIFPLLPASGRSTQRSKHDLGATAADAAPGAAATMTLAQDLYALGVQQGDALTVLAAAKLAASVEATEGTAGSLDPATIRFDEEDLLHMKAYPAEAPKLPPVYEANAGRSAAVVTLSKATSDDDGASDAPVTADQMFAKAIELAGDDDVLIGLIEDAQAEGSRGRIGGGVNWLSRLPAGQTDVWESGIRLDGIRSARARTSRCWCRPRTAPFPRSPACLALRPQLTMPAWI